MKLLHSLRALALQGKRFYCPICQRGFRHFLSAGQRADARCPGCGSLERHRLLRVALDQMAEGGLRLGGKLLHMAPEGAMVPWYRQQFTYLSGDLDPARAMVAMDITALPLRTASMDAVICIHVLEHIPDDRKALAELFRVLKPGGWGSVQVPMFGEHTLEDPTVTRPRERERLFGQWDHVRSYGRDFAGRLEQAGFRCLALPKEDLAGAQALARLSVACEQEVLLVFKPPQGEAPDLSGSGSHGV